MNKYSKDPFMGYVDENEKLYMYKSTNLYEPTIYVDCKKLFKGNFPPLLENKKSLSVKYFCKDCKKGYKSRNGLKHHKLRNHIEKKLRRSTRLSKK